MVFSHSHTISGSLCRPCVGSLQYPDRGFVGKAKVKKYHLWRNKKKKKTNVIVYSGGSLAVLTGQFKNCLFVQIVFHNSLLKDPD